MKRLFAIFLALSILPSLAFAQRSATQGSKQVYYNLTIQTNPENAQITIDDVRIKGNLIAGLKPGQYRITVRLDGYQDFSTTVNLVSNMVLPVKLLPQAFSFSATVNNGIIAQVIINGSVAGQTPFNAPLSPGSYSLTLRANGYSDYTENFYMWGNKSIQAQLQPLNATYQVEVQDGTINRDERHNYMIRLQVFIDGALQAGSSGQVLPGRRQVRISSGSFQAESYVDFVAGKNYVFEPFMGLIVR